jgi:hypothetical protein
VQEKNEYKTWDPARNYIFDKGKNAEVVKDLEEKVRNALRDRWGHEEAFSDWEE